MTGAALWFGIYASLMQRVDRDGFWTQERGGFANHENDYSISALISYEWRAGSLIVADLGRFSQFIAFTRDDANYDANSATGCAGECLPTTWGYNYQSAQLAAFARSYSFDDGFFLRIGGGVKRTTWTHVRHESADGSQSKTFSDRFTQTEYSLAPIAGAGYSFGDWRIVGQWIGEAYRFRSAGYVCCPPSRDVYQIGVEK